MASLGEISVGFTGQFDKLTAGFKGAAKEINRGLDKIIRNADKLDRVGRQMQSVGKGMTAGLTVPIIAAGGALAALSLKAIKTGDQIKLMSDKASLSTTTIQELGYAGDVAGTSLQAMVNASGRFAKVVGDSERGLSTATDALDKLGISVRNTSGQLRTQDDLFFEAIEKLRGLKDETEQMALAQEAFGRGGREMLPILKLSSEEFANLRGQAHDLGAVLSQETVKALDDIDSNLSTFKTGLQGAANIVIESLVPHLDTFVNFLNRDVVPAIKTVAEDVDALIDWFANLDTKWQVLTGTVVAFTAAMGPALIIVGQMTQAAAALTIALGGGAAAGAGGGLIGALTKLKPLLGTLARVGAVGGTVAAVGTYAASVYGQLKDAATGGGRTPEQIRQDNMRFFGMDPNTRPTGRTPGMHGPMPVLPAVSVTGAKPFGLEEAESFWEKHEADYWTWRREFERKQAAIPLDPMGLIQSGPALKKPALEIQKSWEGLEPVVKDTSVDIRAEVLEQFEQMAAAAADRFNRLKDHVSSAFAVVGLDADRLGDRILGMLDGFGIKAHTVFGQIASELIRLATHKAWDALIGKAAGFIDALTGGGGFSGSLADKGLGLLGIGSGGAAGAMGMSGAVSAGGIAIPAAAPVGKLAGTHAIAGGAAGGSALGALAAGAGVLGAGYLGMRALGLFDDRNRGGTAGIRNSSAYRNFMEGGQGRSQAARAQYERQQPTVIVNVDGSIYGDDGKERMYDEILRHIKTNGG